MKISLTTCYTAQQIAVSNPIIQDMFTAMDIENSATANGIKSEYKGFDQDTDRHTFLVLFNWKKNGTQQVYDLLVPVFANSNWVWHLGQAEWINSPD